MQQVWAKKFDTSLLEVFCDEGYDGRGNYGNVRHNKKYNRRKDCRARSVIQSLTQEGVLLHEYN